MYVHAGSVKLGHQTENIVRRVCFDNQFGNYIRILLALDTATLSEPSMANIPGLEGWRVELNLANRRTAIGPLADIQEKYCKESSIHTCTLCTEFAAFHSCSHRGLHGRQRRPWIKSMGSLSPSSLDSILR